VRCPPTRSGPSAPRSVPLGRLCCERAAAEASGAPTADRSISRAWPGRGQESERGSRGQPYDARSDLHCRPRAGRRRRWSRGRQGSSSSASRACSKVATALSPQTAVQLPSEGSTCSIGCCPCCTAKHSVLVCHGAAVRRRSSSARLIGAHSPLADSAVEQTARGFGSAPTRSGALMCRLWRARAAAWVASSCAPCLQPCLCPKAAPGLPAGTGHLQSLRGFRSRGQACSSARGSSGGTWRRARGRSARSWRACRRAWRSSAWPRSCRRSATRRWTSRCRRGGRLRVPLASDTRPRAEPAARALLRSVLLGEGLLGARDVAHHPLRANALQWSPLRLLQAGGCVARGVLGVCLRRTHVRNGKAVESASPANSVSGAAAGPCAVRGRAAGAALAALDGAAGRPQPHRQPAAGAGASPLALTWSARPPRNVCTEFVPKESQLALIVVLPQSRISLHCFEYLCQSRVSAHWGKSLC